MASTTAAAAAASTAAPLRRATPTISPHALVYLRPEVEYRLRYVIQEAWKIARRARRQELLASDVEAAYAYLTGSRLSTAPSRHVVNAGLHEREGLMQSVGVGGGNALDAAAVARGVGEYRGRGEYFPRIPNPRRCRLSPQPRDCNARSSLANRFRQRSSGAGRCPLAGGAGAPGGD